MYRYTVFSGCGSNSNDKRCKKGDFSSEQVRHANPCCGEFDKKKNWTDREYRCRRSNGASCWVLKAFEICRVTFQCQLKAANQISRRSPAYVLFMARVGQPCEYISSLRNVEAG